MRIPERKHFDLIGIGLITVAALCIYFQLIQPQGPPTWDGAEHALYGRHVYSAVESGNVHDFFIATASQNLWPFLHSWLLALMFLITGPSFFTARIVSLLLWICTAAVTMMMTRKLMIPSVPFDEHPPTQLITADPPTVAALTALLLFLTSPMMMLYAAQPMLEMQGAFLTILTLSAAMGKGKKSALMTGLLLLITLFTKYVYAQLLAVALGLNLVFDIIGAFRTACLRRKMMISLMLETVLIFGPAVTGGILWFLRPDARAGYMAAMDNPSIANYSVMSPVNLIIYPVLLLLYYFASPLTGLPVLGLLFRQPFRSRSHRIGSLYILASVLMLTVYWYKLTRAVFTVAPVMFAVASANVAVMSRTDRTGRWARIGIILILCHIPFAFIPGRLLTIHPAMRQEAAHMFNFEQALESALASVARAAAGRGPVGIIGDFHTVNPPLVRWVFQQNGTGQAVNAYSLVNWSKPVDRLDLADTMKSAHVPIAVVIRVIPGSRFDTEDYRDHYGWMTRHLVINESCLTKMYETTYDNAVIFQVWSTR